MIDLNQTWANSSDLRRIKDFPRRCRPERESLAKVPYNEDPKLAFVINSILAVVHGLDKMHKQVNLTFLRVHEDKEVRTIEL